MLGAGFSSAASETLAPRNIWCVGRNYEEHIKELGNQNSAPTTEPMIFLKAGTSMLPSGQTLVLPSWSKDVHHEIELAIELGPDLKPVRAAAALDLTARDVQVGGTCKPCRACPCEMGHAHPMSVMERCHASTWGTRYSSCAHAPMHRASSHLWYHGGDMR